jgi:hypothetical protein
MQAGAQLSLGHWRPRAEWAVMYVNGRVRYPFLKRFATPPLLELRQLLYRSFRGGAPSGWS